jgi:hypothetical protein
MLVRPEPVGVVAASKPAPSSWTSKSRLPFAADRRTDAWEARAYFGDVLKCFEATEEEGQHWEDIRPRVGAYADYVIGEIDRIGLSRN